MMVFGTPPTFMVHVRRAVRRQCSVLTSIQNFRPLGLALTGGHSP
jgi:hypothetical protein